MNKVVLIGRTTKSPELRYAPGTGTAVCKFTLAVPRAFKKDEADFINCVAFGKIGETIAQYVLKGRQVAVTGSIRTGSYESNSDNAGTWNQPTDNSDMGFGDMTPVDDGDMPF